MHVAMSHSACGDDASSDCNTVAVIATATAASGARRRNATAPAIASAAGAVTYLDPAAAPLQTCTSAAPTSATAIATSTAFPHSGVLSTVRR